MQDIYPDFYRRFRCIANRCEDSCCKDWDIDIDSATEAFYQTVQGSLGDKLRCKLVTDEYGERVFKTENGRCPFWNDDMLCDIFVPLRCRINAFGWQNGTSILLCHTNNNVTSTPIMDIVGKRTHGMHYIFWIPTLFKVQTFPLHHGAV